MGLPGDWGGRFEVFGRRWQTLKLSQNDELATVARATKCGSTGTGTYREP